jgi:MFS family permease
MLAGMAVYMAAHLGLSAAVIGTVFTIHLAMGRALPIITGPLVDRFGFRNMMVLGLLVRAGGFGISASAMMLTPSYAQPFLSD